MIDPALPIRGWLLDCARTMERPQYYENAFDFLSKRGINRVVWHFCDDQGCQLQFRSVQGIGSLHAYTVNETRKLVRLARERGITLIPEIASLGHSRYITRLPQYQHLDETDEAFSGMCPVHPDTRAVIGLLVRETMDVFDVPEIHVGLDEVGIGQHPLTREALRTRSHAQIMADHIRFVHDIVVTEGGREMWMWADSLLASPELLGLVPRDIVACNWQYRPEVDPSSTQKLLDAGFDVVTASALLSHDQTLFPSSNYALKNVRALDSHRDLHSATTPAKVRGEIVTTWIPCRSLSEAQWLGWHLAIDTPGASACSDQSEAIRSFGRDFHGLSETDAWCEVCRTLLELAPQRPEWMSVIKLESLSPELECTMAEKAGRWQSAQKSMQLIAPLVRSHHVAFDTLRLLIELLAHAYTAAAHLGKMDTLQPGETAVIHTLLGQRRELLVQLDAAWDRERFADDPSKFHPVVRFFRDDHLLLIVRDGLVVLEQRLAAVPAAPQYLPDLALPEVA